MDKRHHTLARHLAWVVAIKLAVLSMLWWAFIAPQRHVTTAAEVSAHMVGATGTQTTEK